MGGGTLSHAAVGRCRGSSSGCRDGATLRWVGAARGLSGPGALEEPRGARGCGVDRHRAALCFDFLPSAEPISSSVTCAVWDRGSLARHRAPRPRGQPHAGR